MPVNAVTLNSSEKPGLPKEVSSPLLPLSLLLHAWEKGTKKKKKKCRFRQIITGQDAKVQTLPLHSMSKARQRRLTSKVLDLLPASPHCWSFISQMKHCRELSVLLSWWWMKPLATTFSNNVLTPSIVSLYESLPPRCSWAATTLPVAFVYLKSLGEHLE